MSGQLTCFSPWTDMQITPLRLGTLCCCNYQGLPFYWHDNSFNIKSIWGGEWYRKLRSHFRDQDFKDSGCFRCSEIKNVNDIVFSIPSDLTNKQEINYRSAIDACMDCSVPVDNYPVFYNVMVTYDCNMKCRMCVQHETRDGQKIEDVHVKMIMDDINALESADAIRLFGGEPLVSKEGMALIDLLSKNHRLKNLQLNLITNGQLLDRVMSKLVNIDRLYLSISIDALGSRYKNIRVGGDWDKLVENIDRILEIKEKYRKGRWKISASCVLMNSTIEHVSEFAEWCFVRGIDPVYLPLTPTRKTHKEDLVGNPKLLENVNWLLSLQRAENLLKNSSCLAAANTIAKFKKQLCDVSNYGNNQAVYFPEDPDGWIKQEENVLGKSVAIWGTGGNYRDYWQDWVVKYKEKTASLLFLDNNHDRWGTEFAECFIYPPVRLVSSPTVDIVILAMTPPMRKSVISQIIEMGWQGILI